MSFAFGFDCMGARQAQIKRTERGNLFRLRWLSRVQTRCPKPGKLGWQEEVPEGRVISRERDRLLGEIFLVLGICLALELAKGRHRFFRATNRGQWLGPPHNRRNTSW
jgi:hypothetical protein